MNVQEKYECVGGWKEIERECVSVCMRGLYGWVYDL